MDIEAGNDKVQAQLGLTEAQSGVAGAAAGSLYANNYGESMAQIQEATGAVMSSMAGMRDASQADLEDITAKALNLAAAFDVDVNEATASAGILMKTGLATDADQAMDLITDAMQGVPASMRGEIFPIMDEYAKHFATLGIDGTTAFGIVKNAAQDGAIGMDKIGDALKEFTLKAVSTDKPVVEAFESIGLKAGEMQAAMAAGGDAGEEAFAKTIHGLQGIKDPAEQAQTAIALFGTPLEDLGTDNIPAFLGQLDPMGDAFDDVAGAADQMNKDLNSNAKAGFDGFVRQADAALIGFVQNNIMPSVDKFASFLNTDVGPAIKNIAGWVDDTALPALKDFQQWFTDNLPEIQNWASGIAFIMFPLFLRIAISAAVSAAAQVVAWALAAGGAVKTAAVYVAQSYIMIGRWIAMAAAAIASGAVTVAIWALYAAEAVKGAIAMVIQAAKVVGAWVLMAVQSTINAIKMAASWVIGVMVPAVAAGIAMGIQAAVVVGGWVLMSVQSMIHAVRMAAAWFIALGPVGWIIGVVVLLAALIIANWETISKFTAEAWANISRFVSEAWNNVVRWVTEAINNVSNTISSVLGTIKALWGMAWGWISAKVSEIWEGIKTGVSRGIDGVVGFVRDLPGKVLGFFTNAGSLLLGAGGQIIDGFLKGLERGFESVKNFVGGIGQWIADNKGPKAYDLALLVPAGGWIMKGLGKGIEGALPGLKKTLGNVSATISTGVTGGTVGLSGTALGRAAAGGPDNSRSITYSPTYQYMGETPETVAARDRARLIDALNVYA